MAAFSLRTPPPGFIVWPRIRRGARDGARAVRIGRIGGLLLAAGLLAGALAGAAQAQNAAEVAFWNRVRDSTNSDELKAYLEAYPNGAFAPTARARLQQLAPIAQHPQGPPAPATALADAAVIREVQERLYNLNYEIGVLNGQMTEETRNAIREWQRNVKREPTGELSERPPSHHLGGIGLRCTGCQRRGLEPAVAPGSRQCRPRRLPRACKPRQLQGRDGCWFGLRRARLLHWHGASHDPLGCLRHRAPHARAGHGPCAQRVPGPG